MIGGMVRAVATVLLVAAMALAVTVALRRTAPPTGATGGAPILVAEQERVARLQMDCLDRPCSLAQAQRMARAVIAAEPLAAYPFSVAATRAYVDGDPATAETLANAALQRDPRNALARAIRSETSLIKSDYGAFLADMERLVAIEPERSQAIVEAIATIGATPEGLAAIEAWVAAAPPWSDAVVRQLSARNADPLVMVRLTRTLPNVQAEYLNRLVELYGPQAAFLAWIDLLPPETAQGLTWPYNPRFAAVPGAPPFNWRMLTDQAEMREREGLSATYFGKGRVTIADQLMLLAPGRYVFGANIKGDVAYGGGGFAWTISCFGASLPLGDAMLASSRAAGRLDTGRGDEGAAAPPQTQPALADAATLSFAFTVPATGCSAQRLALEGRPGEFPKRARSTTAWVNIAPVPAAPAAAQTSAKATPPQVRP